MEPSKSTQSLTLRFTAKCSSILKSNNVLDPNINPRHVALHSRLLERFVELRKRVLEWSDAEDLPHDRIWTYTLNRAAQRLFTWFSASFEHDLSGTLPPIDVLLVWYCFLLKPAEWSAYVDATKLPLHLWSWETLERAVNLSSRESFQLPRQSQERVQYLLRHVDIVEVLEDECETLPDMWEDEDPTWAEPLSTYKTCKTIKGIRRVHQTEIRFHDDAEESLLLAEHVLKFSWDHMHHDFNMVQEAYRPAIDRYAKYMTLQARQSQENKARGAFQDREASEALTAMPDVELVWRTHVLSHKAYRSFAQTLELGCPPPRFNSFWDSGVDNMEITSSLYKKHFAEVYQICLCWRCVASRSFAQMRDFNPLAVSSAWTVGRPYRELGVLEAPGPSERQCLRCGNHPTKGCKPKDMVHTPDESKVDSQSPENNAIKPKGLQQSMIGCFKRSREGLRGMCYVVRTSFGYSGKGRCWMKLTRSSRSASWRPLPPAVVPAVRRFSID